MDKTRLVLSNKNVRDRAKWSLDAAPDGYVVTIEPPKRSLEQNARMWSMLGEIAEQVEWYGQKLSAQDYKDMFTASLRKARVVPGLDPGSFVVMGLHTSKMNKREMSDLMLLIEVFGAERGVNFSDPTYSQYEAQETRQG